MNYVLRTISQAGKEVVLDVQAESRRKAVSIARDQGLKILEIIEVDPQSLNGPEKVQKKCHSRKKLTLLLALAVSVPVSILLIIIIVFDGQIIPAKKSQSVGSEKEHATQIHLTAEDSQKELDKQIEPEPADLRQREEILASISRDRQRQRAGKTKYGPSLSEQKNLQLGVLCQRLLLSFADSAVRDLKRHYLVPAYHTAEHHQDSMETFSTQWSKIRDQGEKLGIDWTQAEYITFKRDRTRRKGQTAGGDLNVIFRADRRDYSLSLSLVYSYEKFGWYIRKLYKITDWPLPPDPSKQPNLEPLRGRQHFTGEFPEKKVKTVYFNYSTGRVFHEAIFDDFVLNFNNQQFDNGKRFYQSNIFARVHPKKAAASLTGLIDIDESGQYLVAVHLYDPASFQLDIDGANILSPNSGVQKTLFLTKGKHQVEILFRPMRGSYNQGHRDLYKKDNMWKFGLLVTSKEHLFTRNELREELFPLPPDTSLLYASLRGTGETNIYLSHLAKPTVLFLSFMSELPCVLSGPGLLQLKTIIFTGPEVTRISGIEDYSIPVYRMLKEHGLPRLEPLDSKIAQDPRRRHLIDRDYGMALWNVERLFPGMRIKAFSLIETEKQLIVPGKPLSDELYREQMKH